MNDEARIWLDYARENLETTLLCIENGLFNPALQNAQQTVEKSMKALCLHNGMSVRKTHSIAGLCHDLSLKGVDCGLDYNACDLLDSIYLPSKYPLGSALPDFMPDEAISRQCLSLAEHVFQLASRISQENDRGTQ